MKLFLNDIGFEPPLDPPEDEIVCCCDICGEPIYEGQDFWRVHGTVICENCLDGMREEARYGE